MAIRFIVDARLGPAPHQLGAPEGLAFQALAGYNEFNNSEVAHARLLDEQADTISFGRYLTSSHFGQAVMENWQSEYLQFSLFIFGTIWLIQRGSPESKPPGKQGLGSDQDQRVGQHADTRSPLWARVGGVGMLLKPVGARHEPASRVR